jgi:hypothetical protein
MWAAWACKIPRLHAAIVPTPPLQEGKKGRPASAHSSNVGRRLRVQELPELGLAVLRVLSSTCCIWAVNHRQEVFSAVGCGGRGCFVRRQFCSFWSCRVLQFHLRSKWCTVLLEKDRPFRFVTTVMPRRFSTIRVAFSSLSFSELLVSLLISDLRDTFSCVSDFTWVANSSVSAYTPRKHKKSYNHCIVVS